MEESIPMTMKYNIFIYMVFYEPESQKEDESPDEPQKEDKGTKKTIVKSKSSSNHKTQKHSSDNKNNNNHNTKRNNFSMKDFQNKLAQKIFSREKNSFYFLEFLDTMVEKEKDDAIDMNNRLNTFATIIELIDVRMMELRGNESHEKVEKVGKVEKVEKVGKVEKVEKGEIIWNGWNIFSSEESGTSDESSGKSPSYLNSVKSIETDVNALIQSFEDIPIAQPIGTPNIEPFDHTLAQQVNTIDKQSPIRTRAYLSLHVDTTSTNDEIYDFNSFMKELIKVYETKKIKLMEERHTLDIYPSVIRFTKYILQQFGTPETETSTKSPKQEKVTEEDIKYLKEFQELQKDLGYVHKAFHDLLTKKLQTIHEQSILAQITNNLYLNIQNELKKYIVANKDEYRLYIQTLFSKGDSQNIDKIRKLKQTQLYFKETVLTTLLDKEKMETIFKGIGMASDLQSIYNILPITSIFSFIKSNLRLLSTPTVSDLPYLGTYYNEIVETVVPNGKKLKTINTDTQEMTRKTIDMIGSYLLYPVRLSFNKVANIVSASSNLAYKNTEYANRLIEQNNANNRSIVNAMNLVDYVTYKILSISYNNDDLWSLLEQETSHLDEKVQEKVKDEYIDIFNNYKDLVIKINDIICKVRCIESFMPEEILEPVNTIETSNVSYYDLEEEEYMIMFAYVSTKMAILHETLNLLQDCIHKVNQKFVHDNKLDLHKIVKSQLEPMYQKYKQGRTVMSRNRIHLGGTPASKSNDPVILLYEIVVCEFKHSYGIDTNTEQLQRQNELLYGDLVSKLKRQKHSSILKFYNDLIQEENKQKYLGLLKGIYHEYSKQQPKNSVVVESNFLHTISNSIHDLRIKLSFELFSTFIHTTEYKNFKKNYNTSFMKISKQFNETKNSVFSMFIQIGGYGLSMFINNWHYIKSLVSKDIERLANETGYDKIATKVEKNLRQASIMTTNITKLKKAGWKKRRTKKKRMKIN